MCSVIGVGEVLWDVFPDKRLAGGAPFNFAWHAKRMGNDAAMISRVGEDDLGREILNYARAGGLDLSLVQYDSEHATGTVQVTLMGDQPSYEIVRNVAWDFVEATPAARAAVADADVVCFGSLAQRSEVTARTIQDLLGSAEKATIVFDANLRQEYYNRACLEASLRAADILKLNEDEILEIGALLFPSEVEPEAIARALLSRYVLQVVVETRGADGCVLYTDDRTIHVPGIQVETVDCVGSGDAFTAALADSLAGGHSLKEAARRANVLGAYVAGCAGGTPEYSMEDVEVFEKAHA